MNEYIIVGDTEKYNGCLIYTCGTDKSFAEQVLTKMLAAPTEQDKKGYGNSFKSPCGRSTTRILLVE